MKTWLSFGIMLVSMFIGILTVTAAMDPVEIEEIKGKASIHLTGEVIKDELYHDISDGNEHTQIRVMTLTIQEVIRAPKDEVPTDSVKVYYTYIPAWQSHQYIGGKYVDIAVGDQIEIWLEKGEVGYEPVLGGDSIEHLVYVENRLEPIPEPFFHELKRKSKGFFDAYLNSSVFFSFILLVFIIVLVEKKRQKTP